MADASPGSVVRVVLMLDALVFLGLGVWFAVDPVGGLAGVDVAPTGPLGATELRAMYGGLELGFGGFCVHALRRPGWQVAGLWASLYMLAGLGLLRLHGVVFAGAAAPIMWVLLASEGLGVAVNGWALGRAGAGSA